MGKPLTSKDPFFFIRPGRARGYKKCPAAVDADRHPAVARYAEASGRYSPTPHLPEHWQRGYDRFGDDFEPLLAGIDSQKPTEYAKALLGIDDRWKIIGRTEDELLPEERLAYKTAEYASRGRALALIADGQTHPRHADLLAWTGATRITVLHGRGWGESAFQTAMKRIGEARGERHPRFRHEAPQYTTEQLLTLIDAGAVAEDAFTAWRSYDLTPEQLYIHLVEGIPADYASAL